MTNDQNANESNVSPKNLLQNEFQSILKYLSLYFSSQLKHADLSMREIGFFLILSFTKRLLFIFIFLIGFLFISYSLVKMFNELLLFPESISYFIVGFALIVFPLLFVSIFQKIKKRRKLNKKIKEFQEDMESKSLNLTQEVNQLRKKKFKNEKEFIEWKENLYKEHLISAYEKIKKNAQEIFEVQHWIRKYPWQSSGLGLLFGFSIVMGFPSFTHSTSKLNNDLNNEKSNSEDFLSHLMHSGADLLKEIIPPLLISHFSHLNQSVPSK